MGVEIGVGKVNDRQQAFELCVVRWALAAAALSVLKVIKKNEESR